MFEIYKKKSSKSRKLHQKSHLSLEKNNFYRTKSTNWIKDRKRISFRNVKNSPRNAKKSSKNPIKSRQKLKNRCENLKKTSSKWGQSLLDEIFKWNSFLQIWKYLRKMRKYSQKKLNKISKKFQICMNTEIQVLYWQTLWLCRLLCFFRLQRARVHTGIQSVFIVTDFFYYYKSFIIEKN